MSKNSDYQNKNGHSAVDSEIEVDSTPLTRAVTKEDIRRFRRSMALSDEAAHERFLDLRMQRQNQRDVRGAIFMAVVFLLMAFTPSAAERTFGYYATILVLASMTFGFFGVRIRHRLIRMNEPWESHMRLKKFAKVNGFELYGRLDTEFYPGMLANLAGNASYLYGVIRLEDRPRIEWGNTFAYSTSSTEYLGGSYGYIAIELDTHLPHMVLDSRKNNWRSFGKESSNLPVEINRNQHLQLEGDFNEHFTLYAPKEYEQDALYIFTPDFMALLIDEVAAYDVEIIDNYLFVYRSKPFTQYTPELIEKNLAIISNIGSKTLTRTGRYKDDKAFAEVGTESIAEKGRRLRQKSLATGLLIFGGSIFVIIMVAAMIAAVIGGL